MVNEHAYSLHDPKTLPAPTFSTSLVPHMYAEELMQMWCPSAGHKEEKP